MMQGASLCAWFNARTLRERVVVTLAIAVLLVLISFMLVIEPQFNQQREFHRQLAEVQRSMDDLAAQEAVVLARRQVDPDQNNRQRIVLLQSESDQLQQELEGLIDNLVSPRQMVQLLKDLLLQQKTLSLVSLSNQPPSLLDLGATDDINKERPKLYKHRLDMELSGSYRALLDYLTQLQHLPRSVVWEVVEVETDKYPKALIRMQVYTLSLAEGWIGG